MQVLPAIDIRDGQAVRLVQGDFEQKTVVHPDPIAQAEIFAKAGFQFIHVVDLDGALAGRAVNADIIKGILNLGLQVEIGGGIRTLAQIEEYLSLGVSRVIIGSAALSQPELVREAVELFEEKIAVGIDAKNGKVAVSGWLEVSQTDYLTLAKEMAAMGVKTIIYTDISKDGTLAGPTLADYQALQKAVPAVKIIASGGVASQQDLFDLAQLHLAGAIVGKAYYSGKVSLEEMLEVQNVS
ncbi:1-(5-phosphoribosyl)-5-[(5-phosphoribosylamino)methylideneamino]imidazole-4-carboxamide isomerase [Enterococcus sp. HY326]|uniref:1-(5-phosphoribosyl)-5-[(5- phosphoribosylamino)methylideneamino]imidazole-4- carboxamide isomerase n=1 Tax=Enterococcus sp. HY326 TaxID=2971265 RepID=UPI00224094C6|nr:1-(5-phosphoribosyl)-5-[(5-phosphoribosylamino)methylideneamino]imidazole-4-carboxamide isomerase [Enterococcus sp. HY326]